MTALFARHGYHGASMSDLAQACQLSKATLYHHYRDKSEVLINIADGHVSRLVELCDSVDNDAAVAPGGYVTGSNAPDAHLRGVERVMHHKTGRDDRQIAAFPFDIGLTDGNGHPFGDVVLQELTGIMKATARDTDAVARVGGDEFVIVLPDTGWQGALTFAERLRRKVDDFSFGAASGPIGSGSAYRIDVERARRLEPLVREGFADSVIELAVRFVISNEAVSTALVGYSTLDHLEYAAAAVDKGPLPSAAIERIAALQNSFVGEAR